MISVIDWSDFTTTHPASVSILRFFSVRRLSNTSAANQRIRQLTNGVCVPVAVIHSAILRSSRMDKALGKRIVNPRLYIAVYEAFLKPERIRRICEKGYQPEGTISAAFTFNMNELKVKDPLYQQYQVREIRAHSSGSR